MIRVDPNSREYIIICAEQRVRGKSFALGELGKQLLREDDDIMQNGNIYSKLSDDLSHGNKMRLYEPSLL